MRKTHLLGVAVALCALNSQTLPAFAGPATDRTAAAALSSARSKLARKISIEISARSLKDVLSAFADISGLSIQALWADDRHTVGLDPDYPVDLTITNETVETALDRILHSIDNDEGGGLTWQFTRTGAIQIGPRARLNAFKRIEIYDVSDLIAVVPQHRRGPTIDLQQAIQGSGVPITGADDEATWELETSDPKRRAEDLAQLIRDLIETDQWRDNGGDGASMHVETSFLIVNAPDYIHRAIGAPAQ